MRSRTHYKVLFVGLLGVGLGAGAAIFYAMDVGYADQLASITSMFIGALSLIVSIGTAVHGRRRPPESEPSPSTPTDAGLASGPITVGKVSRVGALTIGHASNTAYHGRRSRWRGRR